MELPESRTVLTGLSKPFGRDTDAALEAATSLDGLPEDSATGDDGLDMLFVHFAPIPKSLIPAALTRPVSPVDMPPSSFMVGGGLAAGGWNASKNEMKCKMLASIAQWKLTL